MPNRCRVCFGWRNKIEKNFTFIARRVIYKCYKSALGWHTIDIILHLKNQRKENTSFCHSHCDCDIEFLCSLAKMLLCLDKNLWQSRKVAWIYSHRDRIGELSVGVRTHSTHSTHATSQHLNGPVGCWSILEMYADFYLSVFFLFFFFCHFNDYYVMLMINSQTQFVIFRYIVILHRTWQ